MQPRRLVQLTGLTLILLSGSFLAYTILTRGSSYRVSQLDTSAPTLGTTGKTLTLVTDLACPHCRDFDTAKGKTLEQRARSGDIRLAFVLIARKAGGDVAGNAALCVFEQNPSAFWPYKSALYRLEQFTTETVTKAALGFSLDQRAFRECVDDQSWASTLRRNERLATSSGVKGTPTLIAEGVTYPNPSAAIVTGVSGD